MTEFIITGGQQHQSESQKLYRAGAAVPDYLKDALEDAGHARPATFAVACVVEIASGSDTKLIADGGGDIAFN